jgi:ribosomal protein S18 acetylase RimI-like enzyme
MPQWLGQDGEVTVDVRPRGEEFGVGRAILTRLVDDARVEGYATVRLETLRFMTTAQALYRSFGLVVMPLFDGSEVANTAMELLPSAMQLDLSTGRR